MEWVPIRTTNDIAELMEDYGGFHDSCIVSANYVSGAHVDERLAMHGKDRECILTLTIDPDCSIETPLYQEPMPTFVLADRLEWRFPE